MTQDVLEMLGGIFLSLMLIITIGVWGLAWIRSRKPAPPAEAPESARQVQLLAGENERLTGQIGRLEERIATLERIVTDPAERTAAAIESLR